MRTRRRFLTIAAAAAALSARRGACGAAEGGAGRPSRAVDTHTHFYDPSRPEGVPWPPPDSELHRTVLPDDWAEVAAPVGVRETVVVEASPRVEDNQWILDLAEEDKRILGLVGNLDPLDEAFAEHLERFAPHPLFCGLRWRSNLVDIAADRERVLAGASLMARHGLALDLNGPHEVLRHAAAIADETPGLRIVINHVAQAGNPAEPPEGWRETVSALAARPGIFMKVSGMAEQAHRTTGRSPVDTDSYRPVLDALWDDFGEDRLVFGSNWPVSDRGAPYAAVYAIVHGYFSEKGPEALEKFFWKNSRAAYRWPDR